MRRLGNTLWQFLFVTIIFIVPSFFGFTDQNAVAPLQGNSANTLVVPNGFDSWKMNPDGTFVLGNKFACLLPKAHTTRVQAFVTAVAAMKNVENCRENLCPEDLSLGVVRQAMKQYQEKELFRTLRRDK